MRRHHAILALVVCWAPAQVSAQQQAPPAGAADPRSPELEEVVISADFLGDEVSSLKLDVPLRDVPFSVSDYSNAFMAEIDANRVGDLYQYMTGIQRAAKGGFGITIRGFETVSADRNGIMVDGMPGIVGRFGSPPTAGIERVEVFRGPASVLYGRATPGGFVNLVAKKPSLQRQGSLELRTSSYQGASLSLGDTVGYSVTGDFTGAIGRSERFAHRFVFEYNDIESYRDFAEEQSYYIAPTVSWYLSDATTATLGFEYHDDDSANDNNLAAPGFDISRVAPVTTRYQEPDDYARETTKAATLSAVHAFSEDTRWNLRIRSALYYQDTKGWETNAIRPNNLFLQRSNRHIVNEREYHFLDTTFTTKFATGGLEHVFLFGVNGGLEVADLDRRSFQNMPAPPNPLSIDISIYDPVYAVRGPLPPLPTTHRRSETTSQSLYLSDLVSLGEHWKASLGVRYVEEKDDFEELRQVAPPRSKTVSDTVPMVGLLFQPNDAWSFYSSFSQSFQPPAATVIDASGGNNFVPVEAEQIEIGAKATLADGRFDTTLALFQIDKSNGIIPLGGGASTQVGEERSEGVELETNLRLLDNWQVAAGYAYLDARIVADPVPNRIGAKSANASEHKAQLWSRYDVLSGPLNGLGFGLGLVYVGERPGTLPEATEPRVIMLPSYSLVDLAIYYVRDSYDFRLKATNLLDEVHYLSAQQVSEINAGDPRSISLSIRKSFH